MVQNFADRLSSVLSEMQIQIETKLSSISNIGSHREPIVSTEPERPEVPLAPIFSRNILPNSREQSGSSEADEILHLNRIEQAHMEELRTSWPTFTRMSPSGQMTIHITESPIKFPSKSTKFIFILIFSFLTSGISRRTP